MSMLAVVVRETKVDEAVAAVLRACGMDLPTVETTTSARGITGVRQMVSSMGSVADQVTATAISLRTRNPLDTAGISSSSNLSNRTVGMVHTRRHSHISRMVMAAVEAVAHREVGTAGTIAVGEVMMVAVEVTTVVVAVVEAGEGLTTIATAPSTAAKDLTVRANHTVITIVARHTIRAGMAAVAAKGDTVVVAVEVVVDEAATIMLDLAEVTVDNPTIRARTREKVDMEVMEVMAATVKAVKAAKDHTATLAEDTTTQAGGGNGRHTLAGGAIYIVYPTFVLLLHRLRCLVILCFHLNVAYTPQFIFKRNK